MPTTRPFRPCVRCGLRTRSASRLCGDHRPKTTAKRPERQCTECGERTMSKGGVCRRCLKPERAPDAAIPCAECDIELTLDGVCGGCVDAMRDAESAYDLDDLGTWRFDPVRRIEVWEAAPPQAKKPVIEVLPTPLPDGVYESDLRRCEHCTRRFIPNTGKQRFCNESCRHAANYLRKKAREQVAA